MKIIKLILLLLLSVIFWSQISCKDAVLQVSKGSASRGKQYCLVYDPRWSDGLPETPDGAAERPLADLTWTALCHAPAPGDRPEEGAALVVTGGRCELGQKAAVARALGASALLVASDGTLSLPPPPPPPPANETEPRLPLLLMRYGDFLEARRLFGGGSMRGRLYAPPPPPRLDPALALMLLIAVTTVVVGGAWSAAAERERLAAAVGGASGLPGGGGGGGGGGRGGGRGGGAGEHPEDDVLDSPVKVLLLVATLCLALLLMYFFYGVAVYALVAVFCVGGAGALFACLDAALGRLAPRLAPRLARRRRSAWWPLRAPLALGCVGVAAAWAVHRKAWWAWLLQDVLGGAFVAFAVRSVRVQSGALCSLLLSLLLAYDVFFVFVTPLLTADGLSVMERVALGGPGGPGGHGEALPAVMLVPRLLGGSSPCGRSFSVLGLGDMAVPGLLVAYCGRLDVRVGAPRRPYLAWCGAAYLLGLLAAFAAAALLTGGRGQPALLYLVPSTLGGAALVAWSRGEVRRFWTGRAEESEGREEERTTTP